MTRLTATRRRGLELLIVGGIALLSTQTAMADANAESRLRDQLRQTITQMRQLQDDNNALNAKLAEQAAQLVTPEQKEKQAAQLRQLQSQAQKLSAGSASLKQELEQTSQTLADAQAAIRERDQKLAQQAAMLEASRQRGDGIDVQLKGCEAKNRQFTALFDEVLARYEDRGVVDAVLEREPLTGLKRAQLERLTAGYRGKAEALRSDAPAAASDAQKP